MSKEIEGQYIQEKVDKLYPGALMFDAMRIWALPEKKKNQLEEHLNSGKYFGQIKKDGNWFQHVTAANGTQYLFSRNESVDTGLLTERIDNVPHIKEALSSLPPHTIVIGEVYYPGKTSNEVRSIMGCNPPLAVKRQKGAHGWIRYYIHDIIYFNGVSLLTKGAWDRYTFLKAVFEKLIAGKSEYIELAEAFEDNLYERLAAALEAGEEGMVFKDKGYGYAPGKKPAWSAIKGKQVDYADVICMGFEEPTKEYEGTELETWQYWEVENPLTGIAEYIQGDHYGLHKMSPREVRPVTKLYFNDWCGSISIGAYDESGELKSIGSVSSGLTDDLRRRMALSPKEYLGQVCKVQMMQKFEGAMRHGIFKGFRDDKNPKECTIASIFGEE